MIDKIVIHRGVVGAVNSIIDLSSNPTKGKFNVNLRIFVDKWQVF